jgi:pimeloyl-ACP methyl ester carboxylesterase
MNIKLNRNISTSLAVGLICILTIGSIAGLSGAIAKSEKLILPPVVDSTGNEISGSLTSLEKITLGGVEQSILIRAQDETKPVLLYLHGGPGGSVMPWVDLFHTPLLEENFVVVHWDQRGAGKSYNADLTIEDLRPEKFVADTLELSNLLRARFNQDKIFLTGQSWGSALGFMVIKEDSSSFHAYIPTSERVAWDRSFVMGFKWAIEQAQKHGDADILAQLHAIEPFDSLDEADLIVQRKAIDFYRGGDYYTLGLQDAYLAYAMEGKSPYYTQADIQNYIPGLELSSRGIEVPEIIGNYNLFESFSHSDIPVHFIHGDNDHNTPADLAFEYYESLDAPAKSFTRIGAAAHMVLFDQSLAWAEALVEIKNKTLGE